MSAASRPVSTGKTRTCPHCKATILESLSICPGCMHHLRFDSEAAKRQVAAAPALRVEGVIRHPPLEQPLEYFVIIAIRNDRGEEVTRQVVNVGALQAAEKRTFTLSVEVLPPQAPVATKSPAATGTFKAPTGQPATAAKPSSPTTAAPGSSAPPTTPGASTGSGGSSTTTTQTLPASAAVKPPGQSASRPGSGSNTPGAGATPPGGYSSGLTRAPGSPGGGSFGGTGSSGSSGGTPAGGSGGGTSAGSGAPGAGSGQGAGTAKPADKSAPAKPTSGYILKPPSPGGPKRH